MKMKMKMKWEQNEYIRNTVYGLIYWGSEDREKKI